MSDSINHPADPLPVDPIVESSEAPLPPPILTPRPLFAYTETRKAIGHGHGKPPLAFLILETKWGKTEEESVFAQNDHLGDKDIYNVVYKKLGPYPSAIYRRAVMLEVMRVLAGDESDWNWREGRDTTAGPQTPDQMEAGCFQVSYDSRHLGADLQAYLTLRGITSAEQFRQAIMDDPIFDMAYTARLLRDSTRWDGPLNRQWVTDQVRPECVNEFVAALQS